MAFTPYADFDEFAAWAQIQGLTKGPIVDEVLSATTRAIDEFCQRHFWQDGSSGSEVIRTFAASNRWRLDLGPFNDLVSVTATGLKTDEAGDGTFETTWATSDYQLQPVNRPTGRPFDSIEAVAGRLFPVRCWPDGRADRVQVTGIWGWPAPVPTDVKLACKIRATQLFTRMQSPNGVAGVGDFGPIRADRPEDRDVVALLNPYRRVAVMVA